VSTSTFCCGKLLVGRECKPLAWKMLSTSCLKSSVFWDTTRYIPVKINRRFEETCRLYLQDWRLSQARYQDEETFLAACFILVLFLAYSSALKMEATCSSETSFDFHRTTWCYIREDRILHNHCCENLISYNFLFNSTAMLFDWLNSI
jgi:hypothetical protein